MHPPDVCPLHPLFEPVVFGVRKAFTWPATYLTRMRVRYAIAYWNPTPGAEVEIAGQTLALDRGNLLLIPAGTWFQRRNLAPFDHWWSHLHIRGQQMRDGGQLIQVDGDLLRLLKSVWQRCWSSGPADPGALAEMNAVLAVAMTRVEWSSGIQVWSDPRLEALARWLETQGYPALPNDQLAERVGMHPKSFCRSFHQDAGAAPQDWLRARRLDLAAERMEQGMTVEEAADSGGFSDRSHFSRLFSRHHGVNPGHYRRLAQARGAPEPQIDPGPHTPT